MSSDSYTLKNFLAEVSGKNGDVNDELKFVMQEDIGECCPPDEYYFSVKRIDVDEKDGTIKVVIEEV